jgi:hypothetical protein
MDVNHKLNTQQKNCQFELKRKETERNEGRKAAGILKLDRIGP